MDGCHLPTEFRNPRTKRFLQRASMNKGRRFGGGQSSLGYLFESDEKPTMPPGSKPNNSPSVDDAKTKPPSPTTSAPPPDKPISNNYHRAQGQNSGNFITGRPSIKVKSAPGGDSSLGYLFGDK